ncbi:MAG: DUF393 domain-containing protein [Silicimonas sp.]|nr:DUF393 domain-containing protein [Silicimonas sp.]
MQSANCIAVMDADCSLCARGAGWIARHDHRHDIRLVPIQSDMGRYLLARHGLNPSNPESWLFIEDSRGFTALDGYIRVGQRLGGIWRMLAVLRVLPKPARDALYSIVARNRYRLFRRTGRCTLPGQNRPPQSRHLGA